MSSTASSALRPSCGDFDAWVANPLNVYLTLTTALEPFPDEFEPARASTDVGNVSWRVPTSGFRTACYTYGAPGHSWQIVACTGMTIGEKGLNCAAKVMAASALDLLTNPEEIEAARKDFEQRRSGRAPRSLIPDGQRPPSAIR